MFTAYPTTFEKRMDLQMFLSKTHEAELLNIFRTEIGRIYSKVISPFLLMVVISRANWSPLNIGGISAA